MLESDLYPPIKRFLEGQGYEVKGEVGKCDVVAYRGDEPPVIVELKLRFNLALILQAVDRLSVSDTVYIAFQSTESKAWRARKKQVQALLRRLGVGMLTVSDDGRVIPLLDPGPYAPRKNKKRQARLLKEFAERVGDPEDGGSSPRQRLTAYRQDALRCASVMAAEEAVKVKAVREQTGVQRAGPILRKNHYGWFDRIGLGAYVLSPKGHAALEEWATALVHIQAQDEAQSTE